MDSATGRARVDGGGGAADAPALALLPYAPSPSWSRPRRRQAQVVMHLLHVQAYVRRELCAQRRVLRQLTRAMTTLTRCWRQRGRDAVSPCVSSSSPLTRRVVAPQCCHTLHELLLQVAAAPATLTALVTMTPRDDDGEQRGDEAARVMCCRRLVHRHLVACVGDEHYDDDDDDGCGAVVALPPSHAMLFGSLSGETLALLLPHLRCLWSRLASAALPRARASCDDGGDDAPQWGVVACALARLLAFTELAATTPCDGARDGGVDNNARHASSSSTQQQQQRPLLRSVMAGDVAARACVRFMLVDVCEARDVLADVARRHARAPQPPRRIGDDDENNNDDNAARRPGCVDADDVARLAARAAHVADALQRLL